MTQGKQSIQTEWEPVAVSKESGPSVGNMHKLGIEALPQVFNQPWKWVVKVLIFASAKSVPRHVNAAAEQLGLTVEPNQIATFLRGQKRRKLR